MIDILSNIPLDKLGWTALHFFWLSGLFLGIIALVLRFLKKPSRRYRIAQTALIIALVLPIALWIEKPMSNSDRQQNSPDISLKKDSIPNHSVAAIDQNSTTNSQNEARELEKLTQSSETELNNTIYQVEQWFSPEVLSWIGSFWIAGSASLLLYVIGGLIVIARKNWKFESLQDEDWLRISKKLAARLKISHNFRLLRSSNVSTPCVVGILNPKIWIPTHLVKRLDQSQIKALLGHELIHIKRRDYLAGIFQHLSFALLFIQPLIWWLVNKLQQEREMICDEQSAHLHKDNYHYASTLLWVKKHCSGKWQRPLAGLNATEHQLIKRIRRLATLSNTHTSTIKLSSLITISLLLIFSVFGMGWTTYQLQFDDSNFSQTSGDYTVTLDTRRPNPYNGGGMAVILPWNQLSQENRKSAILPDIPPNSQLGVSKFKFTGGSNPQEKPVLALFVNPTSATTNIYVDKNRNLDFTDDGPNKTLTNGSLTVAIPNPNKPNAKHLIRWQRMEAEQIAKLQQRPKHWTNEYSYLTIYRNERLNHSTGSWTYDGYNYSITLIDRNLNGVFGELNSGFLAINKHGTESLDQRRSYFLHQMPVVTLGSTRFKVVDIKPDGTVLTLRKLGN